MKYTLRQLEVFLAVAKTENITRAAKSLAMSQSAASSSLQELERQFNLNLFDRVGRRLQLSEQGILFRPQVAALLEQADELQMAFGHHSEVGHLKLGATLTVGNYLAVQLVVQFIEKYPSAKVELAVENTATIVKRVKNFELDLGMIEGEVQNPDLEVLPWLEDELVVFCAPEHPLAKKGILIDDDLVNATWILREEGSGTRQIFDRAFHDLLPKLNVLMELQHTEAIKRAVEAKLGVSCLSKVALEAPFERGSLVPLVLENRNRVLTRYFSFILHKQKYRSAGITNWLALCQEEIH